MLSYKSFFSRVSLFQRFLFLSLILSNPFLSIDTLAQWMDISSNRNAIQFIGNGVGFMAGGSTILKTTDNGKNWVNLTASVPSNYNIEYIATFNDGQHIKAV